MLQKKLVKLFLAPREGQWVFFATTMTNDEKFGLTFSRSFCLPMSSVVKVGKNFNYDSSSRFSFSKLCSLSRCDAASSFFNGNSL
jgi:hypothetical protein